MKKQKLEIVPEIPGVYWLRCKNKQINRLNGIDKEGILEIGESTDLHERLRTFYRAAQGKSAAHSEGQRYWYLRMNEFIGPVDKGTLEFKYEETQHHKEKEGEELERYEQNFGELPPLNRAGGWLGVDLKKDIKQMSLQ